MLTTIQWFELCNNFIPPLFKTKARMGKHSVIPYALTGSGGLPSQSSELRVLRNVSPQEQPTFRSVEFPPQKLPRWPYLPDGYLIETQLRHLGQYSENG